MIGLALVTFVTVFAAGLKSSVAQVVDENFAGGLVIQNTDGFSPIPDGAAAAARKVPGVESGGDDPLGAGEAARRRRRRARVRAPARDIDRRARQSNGSRAGPAALRDLATTQAVVSDSFASDHGLEVGRPLPPAEPDRPPSRASGSPASSTRSSACFGSVLVTQPAMARDFGQTQDTIDFVKIGAGRRRRPRSRRC